MFKQANAFLRSRDGPTTPEHAGLTGQPGAAAATEATCQERKESVLGELRNPSAGAGGVGGLPLPTVDSGSVCLAGATPSAVDLDLLHQEVRGFRKCVKSVVYLVKDQGLRKECPAVVTDTRFVFYQSDLTLGGEGSSPSLPKKAFPVKHTTAFMTPTCPPPSQIETQGQIGKRSNAHLLNIALVLRNCSFVQLMPDQFKAVLAGLFELARGKIAPPSSAAIAAAAPGLEPSPGEPVGSGEPAALDKSGGAGREGGTNRAGIRSSGENNVDTQPVATEETVDSSTAGQDNGGGQGSGSAMLFAEGEEASTSNAGTAPPDWLADPKAFVSRVLLWAEEGSAKRSKFVRTSPPKRVFPL